MKLFKGSMLLSLMLILFSFQSDEKIRVNFKKDQVLVNKVAWSTFERNGTKYFLKTLSGQEYVILTTLKYGTGEYHSNGQEIDHHYLEVKFSTEDIETFEVDRMKDKCVENMYITGVLVNDVFNLEAAKEFKRKFEDKVSERRFKTK